MNDRQVVKCRDTASNASVSSSPMPRPLEPHMARGHGMGKSPRVRRDHCCVPLSRMCSPTEPEWVRSVPGRRFPHLRHSGVIAEDGALEKASRAVHILSDSTNIHEAYTLPEPPSDDGGGHSP